MTPGGKVLDIDLDGSVDPLTDGLTTLRRMFGFSGPALIAGATGTLCQRCEPGPIADYIDSLSLQLDVNLSGGAPDPVTDGLLILRRLFGFSGEALTAGALGNCTRCGATEIADYIDSLR